MLNNGNFFIADPWKALADIVYVKKKIWPGIADLSNDMRIDIDIMQNSNLVLLEKLVEIYPSKRVKEVLKKLMKDLNG